MIPSFRVEMIGKSVVRIERESYGLGIQLSDEWKIAIWAKSSLFSPSGDSLQVDSLSQLIGAKLVTFVGDSTAERLTFDNGYVIDVDLHSLASSAAESMVVYGPESTIVVWE